MVWGESTYGDGDESDMSMDSGEEAALPVWGISPIMGPESGEDSELFDDHFELAMPWNRAVTSVIQVKKEMKEQVLPWTSSKW